MDGQPARGETIPIRLFLGGFDLTPTFRDVNKKFSTRYYLSLVLIDEAAHAAEERLEKSKNRGISAPGKLSAQLEAEKKKTRTMLLDDIIKEKQIERNLKQTDLQ
ncbi:unnamed protein product, partial [Pneumocystis jirovecii]